jgi:ABC-type nitrate/sulfonate/bicarbonate transport system substrate-binding protein
VTATSIPAVKLIAFPGAPNLPIFAALEQGAFERAGVKLDLETTPNSSYQAEALAAGKFDIAGTAFDNVVAYREGQGAVAFAEPPNFFAFMGATQIELALVVSPEIKTFADLRGKSMALDALGTGFAFVLYHMLENGGLPPGSYERAAVGATPQRWESVKSGQHAGTMTIEPFTSIAVAQGFRILEKSTNVLKNYQGGIFAARRSWAAENAPALRAFIRGYLEGLAWTLDPANRRAATDLLMRKMPEIKPGVVDAVMTSLLSERSGLTPGGAVTIEGIRTALQLRTRYGSGKAALNDPNKYIDLSYYEQARAGG